MFTNSLKQDVKELKKSEQFVASILKSLYLTERLSHFLSSKHQQQTMCQHLFLRPEECLKFLKYFVEKMENML